MAAHSPLALLLLLALVAGNPLVNGDTLGTISSVGGPDDDASEAPVDTNDICFKFLGCFSMQYPWRSFPRLVPQPDAPENINTTFFLYTRNRKKPTPVKTLPEVTSLEGADYDGRRRTIFITHGFVSSSQQEWVQDMKDALLEKLDANVFLTDWSQGAAGFIKYGKAVSNTRVIAAEIQRLIEYLVNYHEATTQNIHLIGHSLGAQISAYTGKRINNIGRITALDPAQPAFEGFHQSVRLNPTDASFVEVIHTDAKPIIPTFGFGMMGQHGHVDYYINGGFLQPGCLIPDPLPKIGSLTDVLNLPCAVISNIVTCPHNRATLLYTEAIRYTNCTFWGHPGNFVENVVGAASRGFLHRYMTPSNEDCTAESCSPMNLENIDYPARGSFVVATTSSKLFCISEPKVDGFMRTRARNFLRGVSRGTIGTLGTAVDSVPVRPWLPGR